MHGTRCAVGVCKNTSTNKHPNIPISFYRFPKDLKSCKIWITKCGTNKKINPQTSRVCSVHFKESDYVRNLKAELLHLDVRKKLKRTAIPSLKLEESQKDLTTPQLKKRKKNKSTELNASTSNTFLDKNYEVLLKKYAIIESENKELKAQLRIKNKLLEDTKKRIQELEIELSNILVPVSLLQRLVTICGYRQPDLKTIDDQRLFGDHTYSILHRARALSEDEKMT